MKYLIIFGIFFQGIVSEAKTIDYYEKQIVILKKELKKAKKEAKKAEWIDKRASEKGLILYDFGLETNQRGVFSINQEILELELKIEIKKKFKE